MQQEYAHVAIAATKGAVSDGLRPQIPTKQPIQSYPHLEVSGEDLIIVVDTSDPAGCTVPQFDHVGAIHLYERYGRRDYDWTFKDCTIGGRITHVAGAKLILIDTHVIGGVQFVPYNGKTEGLVVLRGSTTVGGAIEHAAVQDERDLVAASGQPHVAEEVVGTVTEQVAAVIAEL